MGGEGGDGGSTRLQNAPKQSRGGVRWGGAERGKGGAGRGRPSQVQAHQSNNTVPKFETPETIILRDMAFLNFFKKFNFFKCSQFQEFAFESHQKLINPRPFRSGSPDQTASKSEQQF